MTLIAIFDRENIYHPYCNSQNVTIYNSDMEVIDGLKIGNKNFTTTDKPYFHTYDHLIHKETHHHKYLEKYS